MTINKSLIGGCALLVAVLLLVTQSFAGTGKRTGTAGALELLIPVGSVGTALGGADLANVAGIEAIHWNPAGLAASPDAAAVMVSHMKYIADLNVNYVAGKFKPGNFGALGFSIKSIDFGNVAVTTNESPDGTGENFSPTFLTFGITYARAMTDRINFGINVKGISEQIMRETATGIAVDFGLQYMTGMGIGFGVAVKNLGPNMKFNGGDLEIFTKDISQRPDTEGENLRIPLQSFELPSSFEIGISYNHGMGEMNNLTIMGAFMNNNFALDQYRVGAEYSYNNMVFLRGSYVLAYDSDANKFRTTDESNFIWGPSFGGGVNLNLGKSMKFSFDYAYRVTRLFDNNQWFTLGFRF
ncbi:MAG: PorV/PorQ family protein [bacterium]